MFVLRGQREVIWSEDVLVARKEACRLKAISRFSPVAARMYAFPNSSPVW